MSLEYGDLACTIEIVSRYYDIISYFIFLFA